MSKNLKVIKDTLKSVKNIKKITKSMEVISAIKAQKANRQKDSCYQYLNIFKDDIQLLLADFKEDEENAIDHNVLIRTHPETFKEALIVITSDRGLCAGYNTDIIKKVRSYVKENNLRETELIGVGKKNILLTKGSDTYDGLKLISLYERVTENVNWSTIKAITTEACNLYKSGHFKKISIVYTKFESSFNFYPEVETFLPVRTADFTNELEEDNQDNTPEYKENPYVIDSNIDVLFEEYFEKFLEAKIYKLILESSISEHFARMFTMKNADKSAADLIDNLSYEYNKSRQQRITQEVSEIMAGVNAQRNV